MGDPTEDTSLFCGLRGGSCTYWPTSVSLQNCRMAPAEVDLDVVASARFEMLMPWAILVVTNAILDVDFSTVCFLRFSIDCPLYFNAALLTPPPMPPVMFTFCSKFMKDSDIVSLLWSLNQQSDGRTRIAFLSRSCLYKWHH